MSLVRAATKGSLFKGPRNYPCFSFLNGAIRSPKVRYIYYYPCVYSQDLVMKQDFIAFIEALRINELTYNWDDFKHSFLNLTDEMEMTQKRFYPPIIVKCHHGPGAYKKTLFPLSMIRLINKTHPDPRRFYNNFLKEIKYTPSVWRFPLYLLHCSVRCAEENPLNHLRQISYWPMITSWTNRWGTGYSGVNALGMWLFGKDNFKVQKGYLLHKFANKETLEFLNDTTKTALEVLHSIPLPKHVRL